MLRYVNVEVKRLGYCHAIRPLEVIYTDENNLTVLLMTYYRMASIVGGSSVPSGTVLKYNQKILDM